MLDLGSFPYLCYSQRLYLQNKYIVLKKIIWLEINNRIESINKLFIIQMRVFMILLAWNWTRSSTNSYED